MKQKKVNNNIYVSQQYDWLVFKLFWIHLNILKSFDPFLENNCENSTKQHFRRYVHKE